MALNASEADSRVSRGFLNEGAWLIAAQATNILGTLVSIKLVAARVEADEYGLLALALTVVLFVNQTIFSGVNTGISRIVPELQSPAALKNLLADALKLWMALAGFLLLCALVFNATSLLDRSAPSKLLVFLVAVQGALAGLSGAVLGILNARRSRHLVAVSLFAETGLRLGLLWILLSVLGGSPEVVVGAHSLAIFLVGGVSSVLLWRSVSDAKNDCDAPPHAYPYLRQIRTFAVPLGLSGLCLFVQFSADRWILEWMLGLSALGLYAAAAQLAFSPTVLVAQTLHDWVAPFLYTPGAIGRRLLRFALAALALFSAIGLLAISTYGDAVVSIFIPTSYGKVGHLLPLLFAAGLMTAIGNLLGVKLLAARKPATLAWIRALSGLVGLGWLFFLIPRLGLDGAGLASLIGASLYGISAVVLGRKVG